MSTKEAKSKKAAAEGMAKVAKMAKAAKAANVAKVAKESKAIKRPKTEGEHEGDAQVEGARKREKKASAAADAPPALASEPGKERSAGEKDRKQQRAEQKRLAQERRAQKPFAEVIASLKPLWETIRQKGLSDSQKREPLEKAMSIMAGSIQELSVKSDTSRIIQSIVTYASAEERLQIAREIKDCLLALSQSQYGAHVIKKLARDSPECRDLFIESVRGSLHRFLRNKSSCAFLDELYQRASATRRMHLVCEVYAQEYAVFREVRENSLQQLLKNAPHKKDVILESLRGAVKLILQKKILKFNIVQRIVDDYLSVEVPSKVQEKTEPYLEHLEAMTNSAEGCNAIVRIIAASSAKDRKAIVKKLKSHVEKLAGDAGQAQILMALLSFVDDTILVGKAIVLELAKILPALCKSKIGQRVVLMLLAGRVNQYITPQSASLLAACDALAAATSKKDAQTRRKELLEHAMPALKEIVEGRCAEFVKDAHCLHILAEYMLNVSDEDAKALLERTIAECGGTVGLLAHPAADTFARTIVKKSEMLAKLVYDQMAQSFAAHLATDSGFLLVVMLRYESISADLSTRTDVIEKTPSEAARSLLAKLKPKDEPAKL